MASNRIRNLTTTAVTGGISNRDSPNRAGLATAESEARKIAENAKGSFIDAETNLRQNPSDEVAQAEVINLLNKLELEVEELFSSHSDPEAGQIASKVLNRELHPYLVRSSLAERCIRRSQVSGTAEILAHVLVDTAGGDGQLGEILDRWLLNRPTLKAIRTFQMPVVDLVRDALPTHRNRRVLLLNAGTGSLVASLFPEIATHPTVLTVVDQSREALAFLDSGVTYRPRAVDLQTVQENLAQFAMGRYRHDFPRQDVVILHGLLEYLPDRIAVSLFTVARKLLSREGIVVASALASSRDGVLLDRLLMWPTIRRSREGFRNIVKASGLVPLQDVDLGAPALLLAASHKPGTIPEPSSNVAMV